jgi:hypothetical protein
MAVRSDHRMRMYPFVILLLFLVIPTRGVLCQVNDVEIWVASPTGEYSVEAKAKPNAKAKLTLDTPQKSKIQLFETSFRYAPDIVWLSDTVARIWVGTGSPDYYMRYVCANPLRISPEYYLAVAETRDLSAVLTVDFDQLKLFSVWSGEVLQTYQLPGLLPAAFVGLQKGTVKLGVGKEFIVSWTESSGNKRTHRLLLP